MAQGCQRPTACLCSSLLHPPVTVFSCPAEDSFHFFWNKLFSNFLHEQKLLFHLQKQTQCLPTKNLLICSGDKPPRTSLLLNKCCVPPLSQHWALGGGVGRGQDEVPALVHSYDTSWEGNPHRARAETGDRIDGLFQRARVLSSEKVYLMQWL